MEAGTQAPKPRAYQVLLRRALQLAAHFGTGRFTEYLWLDMDNLSEHWLERVKQFSGADITKTLAKWIGEREKTFDHSGMVARSSPAVPSCILDILADRKARTAFAKDLSSDTDRGKDAR